MSDTCIVCLGDLSTGNFDTSTVAASGAKSPTGDGAVLHATGEVSPSTSTNNENNEPLLIAHLQPCGHDLHNECLKPWVERANSCPICRASFHLVELRKFVGGEIISTYTVEDRTQVPDLDPSMFFDIQDEEEEVQLCQACGEDDNEDVLMYCDGCQKLWHTYCVGLQEVPYGHWFCDNCRAQREVDPRQSNLYRSQRTARRRTRGQQRRHRTQQAAYDSSWTQVWQSVWDRINLDLDFPYDDDDTSAAYIRRHRQRAQADRQAHEAWRRRMQVAELQGAGGRFRETEAALLELQPSRPVHLRRPSPAPDSQTADEAMAWLAFEQARASDADGATSRRKKRKSATASPAEPEDAGVEVVKRRRVSEDISSKPVTKDGSPSQRPPSPLSRPSMLAIDAGGPSFLQSLLQEVEEASTSSHNVPLYRPLPQNAASPPSDHQSPRTSSPVLSPLSSNHPSPRAMSATPPPLPVAVRPSSPAGLTSSIQPVFPRSEHPPSRVSPEPREISSEAGPEFNGLAQKSIPKKAQAPSNGRTLPLLDHQTQHVSKPKSRIPSLPDKQSSPPQPPPPPPRSSRLRSKNTSPDRATMSLSAKSDVQRLVAAALKPHYHDHTISKEEYITINKTTSRMLYDRIGDLESLGVEGKAKWEKVAAEEVNKAVHALKREAQPDGSTNQDPGQQREIAVPGA